MIQVIPLFRPHNRQQIMLILRLPNYDAYWRQSGLVSIKIRIIDDVSYQ